MLAVFYRLIEDQLNRKFIEKIPTTELVKNCHYIPYLYVKRESTTTSIHIVYNFSHSRMEWGQFFTTVLKLVHPCATTKLKY
jgi:hypothetical protein